VTELRIAGQDPRAERENLAAFVARAVRLDAQALVRLRSRGDGVVEAWTATPFDVLATRAIHATVTPADVTVSGNELLAGLTVARADVVDAGPPRDLLWRTELPAVGGWSHVEDVPASVLAELTDRGLTVARENVGPQGTPPASLLEQPVLTVSNGDVDLKVQLRCLFALSGMGFTGADTDDVVRVSATDSWLRMDARYGAVLRRRHALLPLLF
jgi:hypothetical protein